jgi:hypothetical protein
MLRMMGGPTVKQPSLPFERRNAKSVPGLRQTAESRLSGGIFAVEPAFSPRAGRNKSDRGNKTLVLGPPIWSVRNPRKWVLVHFEEKRQNRACNHNPKRKRGTSKVSLAYASGYDFMLKTYHYPDSNENLFES